MKKLLLSLLSSSLILSFTVNANAEKKGLIAPFETLSIKPEYKNLGLLISENITDAINETSLISMIEYNQSEKIINQLGFKINNLSDDKNAIKLAKYFSSTFALPTTIEINDNTYSIEAKMIDIKSNKIKNIKIESKNLSDLQNKLALQIIYNLGLKPTENDKTRISKYLYSTKNIKALNYLITGVLDLEKHSYSDYKSSINLFDKSLNEDKSFSLANLLKIKSMVFSALLDKQLDSNLSLIEAENALGNFLKFSTYKDYKDVYKIKSLIAYLKNDNSNAKINIKKALTFNQYDSESLYISWLINGEKFNDKSLESALKINPYLSILHSGLAKSYQKISKIDNAINEYLEALKLSNNSQANFELANIYLSTGRLDESIIKYNQVLSENKNIWSIYSSLSSAYRYKEMFNESVEALSQSIKLNPNNYQSYFYLAVLYSEQGEIEKAIDAYKQSIKLNSSYPQSHYYLGTVYSTIDKSILSIDEFEKAISLKPDFSEAYYELGRSYKKVGKLNESINAYKQSIKINSDYPESHLNLGNIYIEQNKLTEAVDEIQKAIKLRPDYPRAFNSLGSAYQKQSKINEAINSYKQAIKIDPKYGSAYYNLSIVYQEQKKVKEALAELKNACSHGYVPACIETKNQAKERKK